MLIITKNKVKINGKKFTSKSPLGNVNPSKVEGLKNIRTSDSVFFDKIKKLFL